jgi:methenyltetrahydrofolate cyclohydrolase
MDQTTLTQFLNSVAEGTATPGGGSVSALAGSLGAALVEMVVNLTLGKKEFADREAELKRLLEEARGYREALANTVAQDINAYQTVMNAYLLPKGTEEEKGKRKEEIRQALKKATDPPLFTAATSLKVLHLCQEVIEKGNPNAITDAAVGALLAEASLRGGIFNGRVNLSALDDQTFAEKMKKELRRLEQEGQKIKEQIMSRVNEKLASPTRRK